MKTSEEHIKALLPGFKRLLRDIVSAEKDYEVRNGMIIDALGYARYIGLNAGIRIDPSEPEWPVVFIELPTGQISWHIPQHSVSWDGHTTEEKYRRINEYIIGDK